MAKVGTLTDEFNSFDSVMWGTTSAPDTVVSGGMLGIKGTSNYPNLYSQNYHDLSNSFMGVSSLNWGDQSRGSFSMSYGFIVNPGVNDYTAHFEGNNFRVTAKLGNSTDVQLGGTVPLSTATRYTRIRESGGTFYIEYGPNGRDWTVLHSRPTDFSVVDGYIVLQAGQNDVVSGNESTAYFDSFNGAPQPLPAANAGLMGDFAMPSSLAVLPGSVTVNATASSVNSAITMNNANALLVVNTGSAYVTIATASGGTATATLGGGATLNPGASLLIEANPAVTSVAAIGSAAGPSAVVFTPCRVQA